eukprot:Plantae.Rhodophyta-Palmaria_palmata.ctg2293.p2 GENE.Plantae.Rhodophyta-Palmaria_palmata.ctg2293~~Plantae.Rhodophyta-Palmaria_palmata.ctg2293.p2  ORF type:complete len:182 (-),score=3.09 Plantae.Rhodophyta-Palmaria_palmata.ctg2293:183-728(-)
MCFAAAIVVRVAAMSCLKRRSAKAFACEVFGAVFVDTVPFMVRYSWSLTLSCYLAPSVCRRRAFLPHNAWIFASDLMMALVASPLVFISWMSVHPVHASTIIWIYLFPSESGGAIGPVVSDDMASSSLYLLRSLLLKGARVSFPSIHGGHDSLGCVTPRRCMYSIASEYSLRNQVMTLLLP